MYMPMCAYSLLSLCVCVCVGGLHGSMADVSKLDICVGVIRRVWEHESSEKLFCEEIDIGEDAPRLIASGLRPFYQVADLQDRKVLVVANLKPRNMGGFASQGMVMCASNDDHTQVKFVEVPASAKVGWFACHDTGDCYSRKLWCKFAHMLCFNAYSQGIVSQLKASQARLQALHKFRRRKFLRKCCQSLLLIAMGYQHSAVFLSKLVMTFAHLR